MSDFYTPRRTRNLYDPNSDQPFKLSRSKLELFLECPKCFYLDRKLGIGRPSGPSFSLNSAVDALLKKEFDAHRVESKTHPLMKHYGLKAIPFKHEKMDIWRDTFKGVQYLHLKTNFLLFGAIDDIWIDENDNLLIVDYKATSTEKEISLDDKWKQVYKRQMEIYQWLARHNEDLGEYNISDLGYFVYCNGKKDRGAFDGKLEFDIEIIPYKGNGQWIEEKVLEAHKCLSSDQIPEMSSDCDLCRYRKEIDSIS